MDLEKLKEAVNTLEKHRKCVKMDCDGARPKCPCDYTVEDFDNSIDVGITVMNDVIKNIERLKNGLKTARAERRTSNGYSCDKS